MKRLTTIGPIIRINPYEVHISDPDFHSEVYRPATAKGKTDKWQWAVSYIAGSDRPSDFVAYMGPRVPANIVSSLVVLATSKQV